MPSAGICHKKCKNALRRRFYLARQLRYIMNITESKSLPVRLPFVAERDSELWAKGGLIRDL